MAIAEIIAIADPPVWCPDMVHHTLILRAKCKVESGIERFRFFYFSKISYTLVEIMFDPTTFDITSGMSSLTIPPFVIWIGFFIIFLVVLVLSLSLIWHWKTYHPDKKTAALSTGILCGINVLLVLGLAFALRAFI
jgi:hypothetical protein